MQWLLRCWLQEERKRKRAFTVIAREKHAEFCIANLPIHVIVDRIDRLEDNDLYVIDYKSGRALSRKQMLGPRPQEPQLAVYASYAVPVLLQDCEPEAEHGTIAGLIWAFVNQNPQAAGFARSGGDWTQSSVSTPRSEDGDWEQCLEDVKGAIDAMAAEFAEGKAGIASDVSASQLRSAYCDVLPLLRLPEKKAHGDDE